MLVLGRDAGSVRSACQCLRDLDVYPCVEWNSVNLVRRVEPETLGILVVEDDPQRATRVCSSIRRWAHESIFPIIVLTGRTGTFPLWRAATTVLRWPRDVPDLIHIIVHMREHAASTPTSRDVMEGWSVRTRLRTEPAFRFPMTLDAHACGTGLLLSGLVSDPARRDDAARLAASVAPDRTLCTAGLSARRERRSAPAA